MSDYMKRQTSVSFLLLFCTVSSYGKFEISVPPSPQVGVSGQPIVLPCTFPTGNSWDPSISVITWHCGLEVVHSFYHSRDQLANQSLRYAHRTSLYHVEMERGNASLRLERTTLEDAGEYTCSVSTQIGTQKKSFNVKIGAFYPEPHIHISLLSNGQIDLLMTSKGGYPSPSLQWLMGNGEDITNDTLTHLEQDDDTKLFNVNSKINITRGNSSITFILMNEQLGQEIRRNIDLFSENGRIFQNSDGRIVGFYVLIVVLFIVFVWGTIFIVLRWKQHGCDSERTTGSSFLYQFCNKIIPDKSRSTDFI